MGKRTMELSDKIVNAHKHKGLVTGFAYGEYSDGKTSYALHVTFEVLKALFGLKDVDTWYLVLDHLFFHPVEAMLFIEAHKEKHQDRVPILVMDDVGQHLPRARWWREDVVQFREWCTVARTDCSCVLFTAPTQLSLPGGIIDACFWRIKVEKNPKRRGWSLAKAYKMSVSPMFQPICSGPIFQDNFPTHYPNFVFEMYEDMRKKAVAPLRRHLISLMGVDKAVKAMRDTGLTQKAIGEVVGKSQQDVSYRLNKENTKLTKKPIKSI